MNCLMLCSIHNLESGTDGPIIYLQARSLLPLCHIDLEESDYLTAGRRDPELCGLKNNIVVDPQSTHVIEWNVLGSGVTTERSFAVINPTNEPYSFEWINRDPPTEKENKPCKFQCCVPCGTVMPGKQTMVSKFERYSTVQSKRFQLC